MSDIEPVAEDPGDEPSKAQRRGLRRRLKKPVGSLVEGIKRSNKKQPREENHGKRRSLSCFNCFSLPSPPESPGKDSYKDPKGEVVKSMIESNDFYCKECNVHRRN